MLSSIKNKHVYMIFFLSDTTLQFPNILNSHTYIYLNQGSKSRYWYRYWPTIFCVYCQYRPSISATSAISVISANIIGLISYGHLKTY